MRDVLLTRETRANVEPMVALAMHPRAFGVDARVCAPADEELTQPPDGVEVTMMDAL